MGKIGKAKKAKKADFAKPKLKVGKTLKKAQNETKTDFKARKIILKEQLALKSTTTLVTKKQHDIKELLSRLNYHNVYVRQDGINGLRELVNRYDPAVLVPHLSTFIMRGSPCILDMDPLIRNSATKFLEAVIIKMGPSIEPYFKILATHLACAMVHLNVGVQGESLQLMKVLIKHTPKLVARHANTVLGNFLNLISRKTLGGGKEPAQKGMPKPKPTFVKFDFSNLIQPTVKNPLAGHMGRLSLLVELSNFLEAVLAEQGRIEQEVPYTIWDTVVIGSVPPVTFDTAMNKSEEMWLFSDTEKLKQFTDTVLRLLMQLWVEIDASQVEDSSAGGNALNEEGVETLSCIVNILMHLWHIVHICTQDHPKRCPWFRQHFSSDFLKRIMLGFPFCCQVTLLQNKKKKKNKETTQNQDEQDKGSLKHCDDLNVLLALFGTQMSLKSHRVRSINFFSNLFRDSSRDGQYNMSTVIKIIKELMTSSPKQEILSIINSAYLCFARLHPLKKDRLSLLDLLLEVTDVNHQYLWGNAVIDQWVEDIVKNLASGEVREQLLQAAIELRLRDNTRIKELLLCEKKNICNTVKASGIQGLTADQIEEKLNYLLKD